MTNVYEILEKVRTSRQRLPVNEAAVLFAAALRLAAAQGATLRARLVQIDDSGGLHLGAFDDQAPEPEPGYLAPELLAADAPRKSEPRVQVYAAGALGFELLTGHVPPGNPSELAGPLGDIIRMALAPDRRERFGDLTQLQDALEGVQPRPPAEGERNIFVALKTRWMRPPPEKEAVARIIEKLAQLEAQVAQLGKSHAKLDASQRQAMEQLDRFEGGQRRLQRPSPGVMGPALLAGLLSAAAVVGAGWALGLISAPRAAEPAQVAKAPGSAAAEPPAAAEVPAAPAPSAAQPAAPAPSGVPPAAAKSALAAAAPSEAAAAKAAPGAAAPSEVAQPKSAPAAADTSAPAADTSSPSLPAADKSAPDDAGPAAQAIAAPDAGPLPPEAPAPVKRRRSEVTQAQLLHAVAISQVRRGEAALEKGNADEALASFHAALENEAALPVAFRGMGMAYAMQGNDAQALQAYQKYLQLAPSAGDKGDIRRSIAELKTRAKIGGSEK